MGFGMKKENHQVISEINVTPLVDVMLVLLIIFMVTAPLMLNGINEPLKILNLIENTQTGNIGDNEVYIPLAPRDKRSKHIVCKIGCCCIATSFCIASLVLVVIMLCTRRP